jgi:hypothetical protein
MSVLCLFLVESVLSLGCFSPVPDRIFGSRPGLILMIWVVAVAGAGPFHFLGPRPS